MGAKWEEQLCFRLARVAVTGGVHLGLPKGEVSMGSWQVVTQQWPHSWVPFGLPAEDGVSRG